MHFTGIILAALISVAVGSYEGYHQPQPYKFGYSIKDKHGEQHREESGDGGNGVKGSYGFTDDRGVQRQVDYVADHGGFRAQVKTNEPGTANQDPAAVNMVSSATGYGGGYGMLGGGYGMLGGGYGPAQAVGGYGYGPVVGMNQVLGGIGYGRDGGYSYSAPLYGGYISGYDSRGTIY